MPESSRGVWGRGRTEVAALRDEIEAARNAGRSVKSIYDEFRADGKISASYHSFWRHVKRLSPQQSPSRPVRSTPAASSSASASSAAAAGSPSRPSSFRLDPSKRLEDLV